ncbi:aromatic-L-amino-acid decarboxylase-like [Ruditapes philippinarum]|uniref:aromatic-L-amino-acid decarboxylase-like n=1 Tax=Ruditapes philippinarum TaxID=129788 RepID=UPI00295B1F5E|nr:aromatic-L-amino-acid decarboxylase-like [Ruditapes philippinarum]XP_060584604.1 aromatic-L-amino-acid decarboxylase-like [Ruditapes philippinarum]
MNADEFERYGTEMVKYIAQYMRTLPERRVSSDVEPGYMRELLPKHAPAKGENFREIMKDVEKVIMPGLTHWQHPQFHAYFPAGNSYPSILGDMLSDAIGCVGFSWAASPACTELEIVVLDWIGKLIKLPSAFLHEGGQGGGVIQGSASECVLVTLLASRHAAIERAKTYPYIDDGYVLSKLVAYSSKLAHSCVEKAGMIGLVKMRQLDVDDNYALRGYTLERAIEEDRRMGLIPFYVCATLGTTGCCSYDNIQELGEVCAKERVWLHVDAAYAGNALICPEYQHLLKGVENVSSINFNPNKWMLVNFDCSLMWVRDRKALTSALTVDPVYLQHEHDDKELDFRHWGIPLSRRFRALKLWFVLRMYGVDGLQNYIRRHVKLAKLFEEYVRNNDLFELVGKVTTGLVCFRLKGPNALTQRLLKNINEGRRIHMVPALVNEYYVIRFAVCAETAAEDDIKYAWKEIANAAEDLMSSKSELEKTKVFDKFDLCELSETESEDEVFDQELFDPELIFDQQRSTLKRACERRNLFHRMVSDPKGFNRTLLRALSIDGHRKIRSESDLEEENPELQKNSQKKKSES